MEVTGEMLYTMWCDCSGELGGVIAPWDQLTDEGRGAFECMAKKIEALAD